jgi:indolepyruvate decarboxylase
VTDTSPSRWMTIGDFLLRRLSEAGVGHLFGVPGDFKLVLLQQLRDFGVMEWVGNCNELNAAYAADGYARLNGIDTMTVTNAVGALSAINGVAGSYSEHVPVICIRGSIPFKAMDRGLGMHHTMADRGNWDRYLSAFLPVTAAQARVSPSNAVIEIDRLILTAWRHKLPVYLGLPSDIAYLEIEVPDAPLVLEQPPSDPERLRSCVSAIAGRLSEATSPAVLVDLDVDRFGVACYVGLYSGKASAPRTREAIESSGPDFEPGQAVPVYPGGFVHQVAGTPHYDGARARATEPAVIAGSGIAPVHQQWVDPSQPVLRQW